ncbi:MAG: hypothetical protein AB8B95_04310 [Pseudohongiellaceae bacterium]
MSKFKYIFVFVTSSMFLVGGFSQRHALACELIQYSNYTKLSPRIFVSQSFNAEKQQRLLSLIESATARVDTTFGQPISEPTIVVVANEDEASDFGTNPYGSTLLSPLGECVIIGYKGHNIDVIAHEYVHAEVHHRIGWLNYLLGVPIWFSEGIALLVDFREPYTIKNIDLESEFIGRVRAGSFDFSVASYQAAKVLLNNIDTAQLYENLELLKNGQSIENVFAL